MTTRETNILMIGLSIGAFAIVLLLAAIHLMKG